MITTTSSSANRSIGRVRLREDGLAMTDAEPLSPSASTFKQNFDLVTPEFEEDPKLLWGSVPVPPFVSDKVVTWVEENFPHQPPPAVEFRGQNVLKKVNRGWGELSGLIHGCSPLLNNTDHTK